MDISLKVAQELLRGKTANTPLHLQGGRLIAANRYVLDGDEQMVDRMRNIVGGGATIFRGDLRVSTNVLSPDGSRGRGTQLAAGEVVGILFVGVGRMAQAVQVFKEQALIARADAARRGVEQKSRQQRANHLAEVTQLFEAKVGERVSTVSSAASGLRIAAGSMSGLAMRANGQVAIVAAAAEQASMNVQTVAVAEKLAASVAEISRQVVQSASIAGRTANDAHRTDEMVHALADGARRIGDVVG